MEMKYDIDEHCGPDIVGSMTSLEILKDQTFQGIYSSHNLEYIFEHEVGECLGEFLGVLDDDGFLVLLCADLLSISEFISKHGLTSVAYDSSEGAIRPLDMLFGYSPAISRGQHYMAHRTGFTAKSLSHHVSKAVFKTVFTVEFKRHFELRCVAFKSRRGNRELKEYANKYLCF